MIHVPGGVQLSRDATGTAIGIAGYSLHTPRVAAVGDSRIQQAVSGVYTVPTLTTCEIKPNGATAWLEPLMQGRVLHPWSYYLAVSGARYTGTDVTKDVLPYQIPLLSNLSPRPEYCVILCGTNDIGDGTAITTIQRNVLTTWAQIQNMGITPIHMLEIPRTVASWTATLSKVRSAFNDWLAYFGQQYGVVIVDPNGLYADPADANGDPLSGYNASDGIHPTMLGAYQCGLALQRYFNTVALPNILRPTSQADLYDVTNNPRGNMLANGIFVGTGGSNTGTGASGSVATSWDNRVLAGTGTAVGSKITRTDAAGFYQQVAYSAVTGTCSYRIEQTATMNGIVAGNPMYGAIDLNLITPMSLLDFCKFTVFPTGGAGNNVATVFKNTGNADTLPASNQSLRLVTPLVAIESGTTDIKFRIEANIEQGGCCTVQIGAAECRTTFTVSV